MSDEKARSVGRRDGEIFLVSALILYLELVLIRWIGTEIRVFAYLGNLILVVCFFGVGLGCYLVARPVALTRAGLNVFLLAVLVGNPLRLDTLDLGGVTALLAGFEDSPVWGGGVDGSLAIHTAAGLVVIAVLCDLIAFAFVPLGQLLGRAFQGHPHVIRAYSVNVAGSLAGVWLFNGLSWWSSPPAVWFGTAAVLLALWLAAGRREGWAAALLVGMAAWLVWLGRAPGEQTVWSPYHKLTLSPFFAEAGTNRVQQGFLMEVNGAFYQHILDLSDGFLRAHSGIFDMEQVRRGHYNLPFSFKPRARRMLIVGAGAGNDAAAGLRHGVEELDCVEIDPQIYALGKALHPERPYDSPHVRMVLDDARAFFKRATGRYDMIWFGWLDSHTLGSSYTNLRLDHYVYTRESLLEAKRLLADDGVLILSFGAERRWIADRLFVLLREVFGHDPLAYGVQEIPREFGGGGNLTLVTGKNPVSLDLVADPALQQFLQAHLVRLPGTARPTTDDWPYLYLQRAKIPKLHLLTSLTILGTVALARRRVLCAVAATMDWHFFALGAAFLLLEVQTVSRATLLFGMTWVVNAIVISAVLVMILLANLVAARWPGLGQGFIVAGLAATVLALAIVPLDWFNTLTVTAKLVAASTFLTAPVFFSGLIFIRSFADCENKARALGSNLIGALVGGLLESVSFVTGIRALVGLVGLFYAIALWLRPRGECGKEVNR